MLGEGDWHMDGAPVHPKCVGWACSSTLNHHPALCTEALSRQNRLLAVQSSHLK